MKLEEKKKIEELLIKIASLHNPEVPPDVIKKHVAQHTDILDKHIGKYGVITHDSINDLREAFSRLPRLKPPSGPLSDLPRVLKVCESHDPTDELKMVYMKYRNVESKYLAVPVYEVKSASFELELNVVPPTKSAGRDAILSTDKNYLNLNIQTYMTQ